MNVFIVIFELTQPAHNRERLIRKIRSHSRWARLTETSYLVVTPSTVVQVRDDLIPVILQKDRLFVGTCPVPSAWRGLPEDVSKWILANQPQKANVP